MAHSDRPARTTGPPAAARRPRRVRRALAAGILAVVATGCGGGSSPARTPDDRPSGAPASRQGEPVAGGGAAGRRADRFDGERAFAFLRRQVRLGPRPAGSPASRRLARIIRRRLPHGRFDPVEGHPGLRNVVGHLAGRRPAVLLGAHFDTVDHPPGFLGAEDGAGGTAAVVEIARALRRERPPRDAREVRFVLFDGEECPRGGPEPFYECGLRGSKPYAAEHAGEIGAMVLLDFIAQKDLSIPRDASSDGRLWAELRDAARDVGSARVFPDEVQGEIIDDHTPFLRAGVPAIDLIDFDFPCWHRRCDDLSAVSERSLDLSGEAALELVRRLRAGR